MDIPFAFGKIVREDDFTDRKLETAKLLDNIRSLTNTAIISPRRWGKSSSRTIFPNAKGISIASTLQK